MTIFHIVLFQFRDDLTQDEVKKASEGMVSLESKLLHPKTGKPYVRNRMGGINNSPEGRAHGMTHGYICEFDNEEDRTYYLEQDPAHKEWVQHVKPFISGNGGHSVWKLTLPKDELMKLAQAGENIDAADLLSIVARAEPRAFSPSSLA